MNIFFFGDSITEGQFVGLPFRWVDIVANGLNEQYPQYNNQLQCFVGANSGDTTFMGMARFAWQVQQIGPDVLFIQFGLNDCNLWDSDGGLPRTSPRAFKANLAEMIDRGKNFGAKHVILSNNHPITKTNDWGEMGTFGERNSEYNQMIAELAAEKSVILNDIYTAFSSSSTPLTSLLRDDNIHLNLKGHMLYAKCVQKILEQILS